MLDSTISWAPLSYSLVVRADKENEDSFISRFLKRCPTNKIHKHIEQDLTQYTNVQIQIHRTQLAHLDRHVIKFGSSDLNSKTWVCL